ncbi:MAG TPA: S24 family peptidase [Alphaproteobacteria bacterium]
MSDPEAPDDNALTTIAVDGDQVAAPAPATLGARLRARREAVGLTQEKLAKQCGVSRAAVAQWEAGVTRPSLDNLVRAAKVLGVWLSWLTAGDQSLPDGASPFPPAGDPARRRIPVIDYVRAGLWDAVADPYAQGGSLDEIASDLELSPRAFALVVRGESMDPEFRDGDKIIIDPEVTPQPGDFVVAKLERDDEATFKKYRPRGLDKEGAPIIELVPINPDWPTLLINAEYPGHIVGTLIEHRRYRRR